MAAEDLTMIPEDTEESEFVVLMTIASQMTPKEREKLVWLGQGIALARELGGKKDE